MLEYNEIPEHLQIKIKEISDTDKFGTLNPETLYNGIRNSTGSNKTLAELYETPLEIVEEIKSINNMKE